jgi:hypothetical protein
VSPVRCELGFYIAEDGILHSHRREKLKSYKENQISSYVKINAKMYIFQKLFTLVL